MNKTVTVNIGGIVFHIDENAYEQFKQYLESIRFHFNGSEGQDEIMQDIESRIAEMFQDRLRDEKQVITYLDVEEVTKMMGKPEQFGDQEKSDDVKTGSVGTGNIRRRLFRNPDDKLLGGVCSGISAYFHIDPVWIRLIFAIAFFCYGSGFLLYIILWIILPKAITTADKLQMRGEPINISNIEKNVQDELEHVKNKLNDLSKGQGGGNIITRIFEAIGQVIKLLILFLGKLIAIFFIFIGLVIVFAMFASLLAIFKIPGATYPEFLNQIFASNFEFRLAFISVILVVGIPFLMLAYYGARILFNIKKSSRIVNMTALGLWIAGLCVCLVLGSAISKDFRERQSVRKEIPLLQPAGKTLVLKMKESDSGRDEDFWDNEDWNGDLRLSVNGDKLESRDLKLDIVESKTDSFQLAEVCYSRGESRKLAEDRATKISYSFSQVDSILSFDPYFMINQSEKYRGQHVQLILRVPKGATVFLDKSLWGFIYDIKNVQDIFDRDMLDRTWEMTNRGLNCLDCDGNESTIGGNYRGGNASVHIDDHGVYIHGDDDDESVVIDSSGVVIRNHGKSRRFR